MMGYNKLVSQFHPPLPKLYIVVRQSPDWGSLTYDYFAEMRAFSRLIGRPEGMLEGFVRLWDGTFGISYFQVREELKKISLKNFSKVRGAEMVSFAQACQASTDNSIFVFTDDDDWFRGDLAEVVLTSMTTEYEWVIWGSSVLRENIELRDFQEYCFTNNYGTRALVALDNGRDLNIIGQHWTADAVLKQEGRRLCLVREYLSMVNRHPTSTLVLEKHLSAEQSPSALVNVVRNFAGHGAQSPVLDPKTAWAAEEIAATRDLYSNVLRSLRSTQ